MANLIALAPKVSKCIAMLGSDQDGEVIAAARALARTLSSAGLDFHDLARAATTPKQEVVYRDDPQPAPQPKSISLKSIANHLLRNSADRMNSRELKFVEDMAARLNAGRGISEKQENWLRVLFDHIGGEFIP